VDLAPRILVAIALDRTLAQHGLGRIGQRIPRNVLRAQRIVGRLLASDEAEALETIEELVEAQRASPCRVDKRLQRDRACVEIGKDAQAARRLHQIESLVCVTQQAEERPRIHDTARASRASSAIKPSISSSVL
jgi:hypothetical protein